MLRYLSRFGLLTLGFGLATMGLLGWQSDGFQWPGGAGNAPLLSLQPLYLLILGIAIVPPTLWDIFQLEMHRATAADTGPAQASGSQGEAPDAREHAASEADGVRDDDA